MPLGRMVISGSIVAGMLVMVGFTSSLFLRLGKMMGWRKRMRIIYGQLQDYYRSEKLSNIGSAVSNWFKGGESWSQ